MAKTDNLTDFLTDLSDGICNAEGISTDTLIDPQDFRDRVEALKLSTQTADATATAANILSGKTAYVNGAKVTGTIATKTSSNLTASGATVTVPAGYYASNASKSISSGSYSASGGGLTVGSNYSGTPTVDITLDGQTTSGVSIADSEPSSGYYLTIGASSSALSGTTKVNRAAITKSASAGYVSTGSSTVSDATSASPSVTVNKGSKTEYLTIPTAAFEVSGNTVKTTSSGNGYVAASTTVGTIGTTSRSAGSGSLTLTPGAGSAAASGTNFSLLGTATTTKPTSGSYLTVTGSGTVSGSGSGTVSTGTGYITSGSTSSNAATGSKSSNTATVYYPITTSGSSNLSVSGATVTTAAGYYPSAVSKSVATGAYSASHSLTKGAGSVSASGTNITLTETSSPSGYYITAQGYGTVSATGTASVGTAGYIAKGSKTSTSTSTTSNTATKYYNIATETKSAEPSTSAQTISPSSGKLLSSVTVAAIPNQKDSDDVTVSGRTVSIPAGYYSSAVSKSVATTSRSAGDGVISMSAGAGSASATGTGITLGTATTTEPTSGNYITVTGSGSVTGTGSGKVSTGAGYVTSGTTTSNTKSSTISSNTATVYYPISSNIVDTSAGDAVAADILSGKKAYVDGALVTGTIATKTSSNLTVSGRTVSVPAGYYASAASKSISTGSAKTPATTISVTPSITVNSSGKITASASGTKSVTPTISAGYVSSGTAGTITVSGSNTKQLTTNSGGTYTPSAEPLYPAYSGDYMTGNILIAGDSNLVASNIKQGVSIFGVTGSYLGYSLSGTWRLTASTVNDNYYHSPAISTSGLSYSLQYGLDGVYEGSTLKFDTSGLWGDGTQILWSGHDYAWLGRVSGTTYPTASITFDGSYNVSEDFYNAFSAIATQTGGGGGGSDTPDIETGTVTINAYGPDPHGYSGNTDFYYTAFENGAIVAKHTSSNAVNSVTLNNVVVNSYLTYNCIGGIALSPSTGASWVADINFMGSQMSQIFEITGTSARFSTYTDCCFEGTSQILLADNTTKNLSEISIGEKLITYNEQTGINEINEVTALGTADVNHNTIIVLEDDTIIQMNKYHPLWTEDGWKSIVKHRNLPKLSEGDKLMNNKGDYVAIKSIEEVEINTTTYYTIKVANNNNFYVNGYLAQGKDKD